MSFYHLSARLPYEHKAKLDALARKIGARSHGRYSRSMALRYILNRYEV